LRGGGASVSSRNGLNRARIERRDSRNFVGRRHDHFSFSDCSVQRGIARPTIAAAGSGPKYRLSSEKADCRFMRKDLAMTADAAALPGGQRTAAVVALPGLGNRDAVDGDGQSGAADGLSGERRYVFQQRQAQRQIAAVVEEAREGLRRARDDQVAGPNVGDRR
jgi:hypothetical protein